MIVSTHFWVLGGCEVGASRGFSLFLIQDWHGLVNYKLIWIAAPGCWSRCNCCGRELSGLSAACIWFRSMDYGCVISLVAGAVGNRCTHRRRWVPRAFQSAEIILDSICVVKWGVRSWGHPWILMMTMWSVKFVNSCVLRRASDIRTHLRNGMRIGRRGGFGFSPGLE